MPAGWLLLLVLASPFQEPSRSERPSLEEVLVRLRARRDAARAVLLPRVVELVGRLDLLRPDAPLEALAALQAELARLPPETAPLIVPYLDPGEGTAQSRRADELALALGPIGIGGVLDELALLARNGSPSGRKRAVLVLARSGGARVLPVLRGLWDDGPPDLAADVFAALLALSDAEAAGELASAALGAGEPERIDAALEALLRTGKSAREAVRGVLEEPALAEPRLEALFAYYLARPTEFASAEAELLFDRIERSPLPTARLVALIERLPDLARSRAGKVEWIDLLRDFGTRTSGELSTACLVALARLGDRGARRDLLEGVGARFANPKVLEAYLARGRLFLRLEEPSEAAREFERAFEIVRLPLEQRYPIGILLARALCRSDKLRRASEVLAELQLLPLQKTELASDPDFQELAASRYGDVLH